MPEPLCWLELTVKIRYGCDVTLEEERTAFQNLTHHPVSAALIELVDGFEGDEQATLTFDIQDVTHSK